MTEIGDLLPEGPDFSAVTAHADVEVALIAGPQLVVPVTNARYALNAANARWGSHKDATGYSVKEGKLSVTLAGGQQTILAGASKFAGYVGETGAPTAVLLVNHGLHIELQFDRAHAIGQADRGRLELSSHVAILRAEHSLQGRV